MTDSPRKLYALGADPGLPLAVGALLDMLRYVRKQTLHAVRDLTAAQLDHRHDGTSNSIGSLLWHIAAVERWYQVDSFEARDWSPEDAAEWNAALELGDAVHNHGGKPLEHYLDLLESVRARTERELRTRDEAWLLEVHPLDDADANNYWKWFHVAEDEIGHTGQIRWLRKRLPASIESPRESTRRR